MSNQLEIEGLATDSNTGIYNLLATYYLLLATYYLLLATRYLLLKPNHKSEVYRITSHNTALH